MLMLDIYIHCVVELEVQFIYHIVDNFRRVLFSDISKKHHFYEKKLVEIKCVTS